MILYRVIMRFTCPTRLVIKSFGDELSLYKNTCLYKEFHRYVSVYQDIWLYFILQISYQLIFDSNIYRKSYCE